MTRWALGLSEWLNRTSMTSFSGLVMQMLWVVGSLALTYACADLLLADPGDYFRKAPLAPSHERFTESMTLYLAMADSYVKTAHNTGLILAGALLAAWGVKSGINAAQHGKDRDTSRERIRADAEATAMLEEQRHRMTGERPAVVIPDAQRVDVNLQEGRGGDVRHGE